MIIPLLKGDMIEKDLTKYVPSSRHSSVTDTTMKSDTCVCHLSKQPSVYLFQPVIRNCFCSNRCSLVSKNLKIVTTADTLDHRNRSFKRNGELLDVPDGQAKWAASYKRANSFGTALARWGLDNNNLISQSISLFEFVSTSRGIILWCIWQFWKFFMCSNYNVERREHYNRNRLECRGEGFKGINGRLWLSTG